MLNPACVAPRVVSSLPHALPSALRSPRLPLTLRSRSSVVARLMATTPTRKFVTLNRTAVAKSRLFSTSSSLSYAERPDGLDSGEQQIFDRLNTRFQPSALKVQDVSGGCGSFYAIIIVSKHFRGSPTVKAHRMVNEELKDIIGGIHGLQLKTVPEEE